MSPKLKFLLGLIVVGAILGVSFGFDAIRGAATRKSVGPTGGLETGLVGYWSFDVIDGTTVPDNSGQGNNGTLTNGPIQTTGQLGSALQFDGVDDSVSIAHSASLILTTDFTLSAWIYRRSDTSNDGIYSSGTAAANWEANINSAVNKLRITEPGIADYDANTVLTLNTWHHVVYVKSGDSGVNLTFYLDGVPDGTASVGTVSSQTGNRTIGQAAFDGSLDDIRVYNRALSANEIKRLYNQAGKVTGKNPSIGGLVGWWAFEGGDISGTAVSDRSGNNNNGTTSGGPTATIGKIGQALQFDGVDDKVQISPAPSSFLVNTYTYSLWSNARGTSGSIIEVGDNTDADQVLSANAGSTVSLTSYYTNNANANTISGNTTLQSNTWYHVVVVRDASANTLSLYLNGVKDATDVTLGGTTAFYGITKTVNIGSRNTASFFNGSLDDVRVYNRALSAAEVAAVYNSRAATLNASQNNRLTNGLVGLWSFNGPDLTSTTATDRSGQGNNGTLTNGPVPVIGKIGQALQFDGVNDYVDIPASASINASGKTALSFGGWSKNNGDGNSITLIKRNSGNTAGYFLFSGGAGTSVFARVYHTTTVAAAITSAPTYSNNAWQHFFAVYNEDDDKKIKIYINGVLASLSTNNAGVGTIPDDSAIALQMNRDGFDGNTAWLNGSIDDVRIYNRALSASEVQQLYNMGR